MNRPRSAFLATLITAGPLSGKVLVVGGGVYGGGGDQNLASSELYDPNTGKWSLTEGGIGIGRYWDEGSIQALSDGSVLVVGGVTCCPYSWLNDAWVFDPASRTWRRTEAKKTPANGTTALLSNGSVLVAGGVKGTQPYNTDVASAEVFNPTTGIWVRKARMSAARASHSVTPLTNGQFLVAGGNSGGWLVCNALATAERYRPESNRWLPAATMNAERQRHTATRLRNGKVLVAGGVALDQYCGSYSALTSAELYSYPQ
jgi:N-acetylneuraminic acid mutarotase